jgi:tetratricopeptide (TPR) repeat protein
MTRRDGDEDLTALAGLDREAATPPGAPSGGRIGPYRLVQRLGEGGMGEVWLAEQTEPIRREVALKVIKAGMDTAQTVARFEAERQALAVMDHPGIARVFDAGATAEGRPFFVMEYIRGESITSFCERHRVSIADRIELSAEVCEAVQHAHQKGIIHRDLKPSNVLVTQHDGRPAPRIIDFGIAKAMTAPLTDATLHTEIGSVIGTPAYMSPEQIARAGSDLDTRSDVYALGVIVYELLTGATPIDPQALRQNGLEELRQTIVNVEPARPSARATTRLPADLDWVTLKALEKDRTRRYQSAGEFAADLRRVLAHEPVSAGPPTTAYRLRRFVRRHRLAVTAAAVVLAALLGGTALALAGMLRAQSAERRAAADARAAEEVVAFLTELFRMADPARRAGDITLREIIDRGASRIDALAAQPRTQARLLVTIGDVYRRLGEPAAARTRIERGLAMLREHGAGTAEVVDGMGLLGALDEQAGRTDEARALLNEAVATGERALGVDHFATATAWYRLAALELRTGRYAEAEARARQSLAVFERTRGGDSIEAGNALNLIGASLATRNDLASAEPFLVRGFHVLEKVHGPESAAILPPLNNLTNVHRRLGLHGRAAEEAARLVRLAERHYGPETTRVSTALTTQAEALVALGRTAEAEPLVLRSLAIDRARVGPESTEVGANLTLLARLHAAARRDAEAEAAWRAALAIYTRALAPGATPIAETRDGYAAFLDARGRPRDAEAVRAGGH